MPWRFGSQVACVVALPKKARASFCVAESLTAELWGPLAPQFYFTSDDSYYAVQPIERLCSAGPHIRSLQRY